MHNILASNWQSNLNTVNGDAKESFFCIFQVLVALWLTNNARMDRESLLSVALDDLGYETIANRLKLVMGTRLSISLSNIIKPFSVLGLPKKMILIELDLIECWCSIHRRLVWLDDGWVHGGLRSVSEVGGGNYSVLGSVLLRVLAVSRTGWAWDREAVYRLRLLEELSGVHDMFHVSNLKKYLADASLHMPLDEIKIDKTFCFVKEIVENSNREVMRLKCSGMVIVKVRFWLEVRSLGLQICASVCGSCKAIRKSKKKKTKVPQPSGSTNNVPDENVSTTSNDPLLSDSEIASLKKKVKKLERRNKSRTPWLKRLRKVGSARMVESSNEASLGDQEDASKQRRKIADIDVDVEVTLIDETQGRNDDNLMFDTGVLDEHEVEVEKVVSTAKVTTESATTTTVDELTLAQTLIEIKAAKPKVRGVMIQEPSKFTTTTTTTTPDASKPSQDKDKAKMIESEKPLKKND
ncbi:hypothetical protein Tco_0575318 [Tanacetum coccineum]